MRLYLIILTVATIFISCSTANRVNELRTEPYARNYKFNDISGQFLLVFRSGLKKNNKFYVKKRLIGENDQKEYEKIIAISTLGSLQFKGEKITILRPNISQYTVWLEKKKYFSQLKIISEKRLLEVTTQSEEQKRSETQTIPFQNSRGVFCFFNQMPDCMRITGFLAKAIKKKYGKMSLTIIWEGYPFITKQYSGLSGPFSTSILSYEGRSNEGNFIFHLNFGDQVIFYHFNNDMKLEKKFWVAQGIEQIGV